MLKKTVIAITVSSMLLTGASAAFAHGPGNNKDKGPAHGLLRALENVKNERAREVLERNLLRLLGKLPGEPPVSEWTDAQKVEADKAKLAIGYQEGDASDKVTGPLTLTVKGEKGSAVVWFSSNPQMISHDGQTVNRPTAGSGDATVVLTALITSGNVTDTKVFTVTVKELLSDAQKVAADKAALAIGYQEGDEAGRVTGPLTLPVTGEKGSAITWISGSPQIISHDGKTVNRPTTGNGDVTVVLTALITSGNVTDTKVFTVTVKELLSDAQKVAADKAALAIGFRQGDHAGHVTGALALPAAGANGSAITWVSSAPSAISHDGKTVNRPAAGSPDTAVTLTAVIHSGSVVDTRSFTVIVKAR